MNVENQEQSQNPIEQTQQNPKPEKPDRIKLLTIAKKASKLLLENKVMESLIYYEQALIGLKDLLGEEQCKTDYQYLTTAIYRELAIAKFGDKSAYHKLEHYKRVSSKLNFTDLVSLCSYFRFLSLYYLKILDFDEMFRIGEELYNTGIAEHILPAIIIRSIDSPINIKHILEWMRKTNKILGGIEPYLEIKNRLYHMVTPFEKAELTNWFKQHIDPIEQVQKEVYQELITPYVNEENNIMLRDCECSKCGAQCCYKGTYLTQDEVNTITNLVKTAPYFRDIGDNFIIKDNTNEQYKTATVWSPDKPYNYPSHFNNTKCIFSLTNGDCALQRYAIDNGYHPWKFKPKACWLFPLTENTDITEENQPLVNSPLTSLDKDKDPNNLGEHYPGYITCLPCMEVVDSKNIGSIWYDKYLNQIEYLKLQKESED